MTNNKQEIWAVIPAAGSGSRMGSDIPKQHLTLFDEAIVSISIKKFLEVDTIKGVIVALSDGDTYWDNLEIAQSPRVHTVTGGASRSESVLRALHYLSHMDEYDQADIDLWVCVHDAARPCVRQESIVKLINYCIQNQKGAILGVPIADTIKRTVLDEKINESTEQNVGIEKTVSRENLWQAHTPQMFLLRELQPALDYCELDGLRVTDEASAIENVHGEADIVLDRRDNIKVTLPEDLKLAEFILQQQTIFQQQGKGNR